MKEQNKSASYGNIFKTTFLFSFVQIFYICMRVAVNKVVAILLGAEGLGIISLFNNAINLLKSGCGLGIKQSAVRDVAEANEDGRYERIAEIIAITNKIVLFTALLGMVVTIFGSPLLSKYSFGSKEYIFPFIILSIAVALNIYAEGQMAILTGMRRLRDLAKANIIGALGGALTSIPFYYILGKDGIVPSLIVTALCTFVTTKFYVKKIDVTPIKMDLKKTIKKAVPMVQMGSVLMIAGFVGLAFDLMVSSFIRYEGGFEVVGYFQAGSTIITGYFGIVLTAMTTDYYPRICGVNKDDEALSIELNKQVTASIVLIFPLAICFVYLAPYFLSLLYSDDFSVSTQYTDFAIFGTIIIVASNCMGMIFMAKMASKLYLTLVSVSLIILMFVYIPLYHYFGLKGLGVSFIMNGVVSLVLYGFILNKKYNIILYRNTLFLMFIVIVTIIFTLFARNITEKWQSVTIGISIFSVTLVYSCYYLKKKMGINILRGIRYRLKL